jgi:serine/threonine-protein kinase RsbT
VDEIVVPIDEEADIVRARALAREAAAAQGLSTMDQSRVATAVSELARNVARYAGHGAATIRKVTDAAGMAGVEVVVEDNGPGIANIDQAMQPGYTSGTGLGLGLSGTRRLMDEMSVESQLGAGTRVLVRKWRR